MIMDIYEIIAFAKGVLRVVSYFILQLVKGTIWLAILVYAIVVLVIWNGRATSSYQHQGPLEWISLIPYSVVL